MLTIWGRATSINVQKVMWLVAELELPHERIDAGGKHGKLDSPEFKAICPHPRIPAVVDGDTAVWESNACIRYLAAEYKAEALWPAEPRPRSQVDKWLEWSQQHWLQAVQALFLLYVRTPKDKRDPARIAQATAAMTTASQTVDGFLADRPYIAGEALTLADFIFGATMYRFHTLEFDRAAAPNIQAYYERLQARPAFKAHVMIDYDELRAPGAERPS